MVSLCHPGFTTTNLSYRFPILNLPPPPCAVLLVYTSSFPEFLQLSVWFCRLVRELRGLRWCCFASRDWKGWPENLRMKSAESWTSKSPSVQIFDLFAAFVQHYAPYGGPGRGFRGLFCCGSKPSTRWRNNPRHSFFNILWNSFFYFLYNLNIYLLDVYPEPEGYPDPIPFSKMVCSGTWEQQLRFFSSEEFV